MTQKTSHDSSLKGRSEWEIQQENLMIAIDQLTQITEVMGEVLTRVKQQVHQLDESHHASQKQSDTQKSIDDASKNTPTNVKKVTRVH